MRLYHHCQQTENAKQLTSYLVDRGICFRHYWRLYPRGSGYWHTIEIRDNIDSCEVQAIRELGYALVLRPLKQP